MIITHVPPDFRTPEGFTGTTHSIVSAGVVREMARRYGLAEPGHRIIDPACGSYMIPRTLRLMGAHVDAADIDPAHCKLALKEADHLNAAGIGAGTVICASMTELKPKKRYNGAYLSLPFDWFRTKVMPDLCYVEALVDLVEPGAPIVIDSAKAVMRGTEKIPVASHQIAYMTAHPAVTLAAVETFNTRSVRGYDEQFEELVFVTAA
jgi:hypothetical protein